MRALLGFLKTSKNVNAEQVREEFGALHDFSTIQQWYHLFNQCFGGFSLDSRSSSAALNENH